MSIDNKNPKFNPNRVVRGHGVELENEFQSSELDEILVEQEDLTWVSIIDLNDDKVIQQYYDRIWTITDFSERLRMHICDNNQFTTVCLRGEISNLRSARISRTGKKYVHFTLKDENAVVQVVTHNQQILQELENKDLTDGDRVIVRGNIQLSLQYGTYSINIKNLRKDGLGDLKIKFDRLKQKLEKEGLFSKDRKRPLPLYPRFIGLITGKDSAALSDMCSTIQRRYSLATIVYFPTIVQGKQAEPDLIEKLKWTQYLPLDVIIIGRGGGSIEDLWAFNEEGVIRAIGRSRIPIVSAIGHEIDYTLCDYVADVRAETPTGAAERVTVNTNEKINAFLNNTLTSLCAQANHLVQQQANLIAWYEKNINLHLQLLLGHLNDKFLGHFQNLTSSHTKFFNLQVQNNSQAYYNLLTTTQTLMSERLYQFETNRHALSVNLPNIDRILQNLKQAYQMVILRFNACWQAQNDTFITLTTRLYDLSPQNILQRGYAIIRYNNSALKTIRALHPNDKIAITMWDGRIDAQVQEIQFKKET